MNMTFTQSKLIWPFVAFVTLLLLIVGVIFANGSPIFNSPLDSESTIVEPGLPVASPIVQEVIVSSPLVVASPATNAGEAEKIQGVERTTGTIICLPKKNTSGPQTMECAYGLQTAAGNYALADTDPTYANLSRAEMGVTVTVTGRIKPSTGSVYDTVGTIEVVKIENSTL